MTEMRDLLPFWKEVQRSRKALGRTDGLTEAHGLIRGARALIRASLQEAVAREAKGRTWPSRSARRDWVRAEVARRYRELVTPDPTKTS